MNAQELAWLLEFCFNATYQLIRWLRRLLVLQWGPCMVSVSVVNLVMEDVEERALATFDVQLPIWKRYINDTCTALQRDRVQHLLQYLDRV